LAFGDDWTVKRIADEKEFCARVAKLQQRSARRDATPIPSPSWRTKADLIGGFANAAIHFCVFYVPPAPPDEIGRHVDKRAALGGEGKQLTR
jgi:hypothetical protein